MKYRHEYKCRIIPQDIAKLRSRLSGIVKRDTHSDENGVYLIKSLYFDNYMDKALVEKTEGFSAREKFRIRYYNNDTTFIRLEKKVKINGIGKKYSAKLTENECEDMIEGNFHSVFETNDELKREFFAKMQYQVLRPKSVVAYDREAYVCDLGNVRITFDTNIRGSSRIHEFLKEDIPMLQLFPYSILEIKWDEYIPKFIHDILQINNRGISSFSKYAATRFF